MGGVEQVCPGVLPGPVVRQVQGEAPGGAGDPGGDVDEVGAEGGGGGLGVEGGGQSAGGPQEVVGHRPQGEPGGVGVEVSRGQAGQGGGFAVGDDLFDHGVVAVFPLGHECRCGPVSEEGVVAQRGNSSPCSPMAVSLARSRTRRTISRAVTRSAFFRLAKAVYWGISATSASEMGSPVSGSGTAVG